MDTFDDGPASYTDTLLDILKKYNVKATFFVIGNRLVREENKKTLKRMYSDGHIVAIHGYNHTSMTTLTDQQIKQEMDRTSQVIFDLIGVRPAYMVKRKLLQFL